MEDKQIQPNTVSSGSLTTPDGVGSSPVSGVVGTASTARGPRRPSRGLLRVIVPLALVILLIGGGVAAYFASRNSDNNVDNSLQPAGNYDVQTIPLGDLGDLSTIGLNTAQSLSVNGQLRANGSLVLSPTSRPENAVKGQMYFDTQTNTPYVFDGTNFVSMSVSQAVQSIGGQVGSIALGPGLLLSGGQLSLDDEVLTAVNAANAGSVTSIQGQTGAVAFSSGNGININGTTIENTGVVSIAAASPQLSVTQGSGGSYNIGIVGNLATATGTAGQIAVFDSASNLVDSALSQVGSVIVASNDLRVAGITQTDTLTNLTTGTDLNINAGSDNIIFTANGRTYQLPAVGPANQTICTVGVNCSAGGGESFVELQPTVVQEDAGSGTSIYINNTGGGDLLRLQGSGVDAFVVENDGDTTIGGNLIINGTINSANISGGNISAGTINGAIITDGELLGGVLTDTSVNGLNVSATTIGSTGALTITAANNNNINLNTSGTGVVTVGGSMVQGAGALTIAAGGTNQDLTLAGSGTGNVVIQTPEFHNANGATYVFDPADTNGSNYVICTSAGNCSGGGVSGSGTAGTIAIWTGAGFTLDDSSITQDGTGNITIAGDLAATNLQGNGSGITNVNAAQLNGQAASYYTNASNIGTGTLSSDRLASDVAQKDQASDFTVSLSVNGQAVCTMAGNCVGSGAGVGGSGTSGTIAVWTGTGFTLTDSLISQDTSGPNGEITIDGDVIADSFSGNGSGLTSVDAVTLNGQLPAYYLNAGNLNAGTLNDARLSSNVAKYNDAIAAFLGSGSFVGTVSGSDAVTGSEFVTLDQLNAAIGGVGGGVTSLNTLDGDLILQGTTGQITVSDNGTDTLTLALDSAVTLQGNVINAANGLVKLDGGGLLPAVNGSLLTNVNAATLQGQAGSYYLDLGNATGTLNIARIADASLTNAKLANSSLTVTAGNGLTDGGLVSLGGTIALNVGAGDGISVTANAIAVDGTVCRTSGNCVGGGGGGAVGGSGTAGTIALWDGTGFSLTDSVLSQSGTDELIVSGARVITTDGTDQDLTLQGTGTGSVVIDTPEFLNGAGAAYTFDTGDTSGTYEVCTTAGNCLGGGTGAITGGGTVGTLPVFNGSGFSIADSLVSQAGSVVTVNGDLVADTFAGDGAALTNLNASNVATGTLNDARLSSNVTLQGNIINAANGLVKLDGSGLLPAVDGSLLTNVNAALLNGQAGSYYLDLGNATGTLSMARIADGSIGNAELTNSSITINTAGGIAGGTVSLGGSLSLSLQNTGVTANTYGSASSVAQFTVGTDGRISSASNVSIAIDASQITSGIIASARLSGVYSGITGTGALDSGSITSGFGSIDTGADPITTTGTVTAGTFNATTGGYQTDGTTRISDGGALQNITGYTQTGGNFDASGSGGTFSTSTGAVTLGGATNANSSLTVAGATTLQDTLTINGSQFTNNGSTLNTALVLSNFPTGGSIGAAVATVDTHTTVSIPQTTAGQMLDIPSPTATTAGRVFYVFNTGSQAFTIEGASIAAGYSQVFVWNGTAWVQAANGGGTVITLQGAYDGGNVISTTDAKDINFTLANTTTDSNFIVNVATSSSSQFKVQNNGADVMNIGSAGQLSLAVQGAGGGLSIGGDTQLYRSGANRLLGANALTLRNTVDTTTAFDVQNSSGVSMLSVDTAGGMVNTGNLTVTAGKTLTLVGGTTVSRPASPTAGTLYYDTSTNQMLQYNGTKWVSDARIATKTVAASNSSQTMKDAADYVATGSSDHTIINTALTAAAGGAVYLMEGTYTLGGAISVPNNTTLSGAGAGTIITVPNSFNTSITAITNTTTGGNGTGVVIRDLTLDGNKANQSSGTQRGVYLNGAGSGTAGSSIQGARVTNVTVRNWLSEGFVTSSSSNTIVSNVTAALNGGHGFNFSSGANIVVTDGIAQGNGGRGFSLTSVSNSSVTGNNAQGNTGTGFLLDTATYNTVTGNASQGNAGNGIYVTAGSNNVVSSNNLNGNGSNGIGLVATSSNTITDNRISESSGTTDNNGIFLDNSDSNSIQDNSIVDSTHTTTNYAINISNSTSDTNYLSGNTYGADNINNAGTGTVFAGQVSDSSGTYSLQPAGNVNIGTDATARTISVGTGAANNTVTVGSSTGTSTTNLQAGSGGVNITAKTKVSVTDTAALLIQNASTTALLTADTSTMQVVIGTTTNGITLSANGITFSGTARGTKTIRLAAEYANAVLDPDLLNNLGTMTSAFDSTNRMNFYQWTASNPSTSQDYDIIVQVPLPQDFSAWASSTPLTMSGWTDNTTNGTITYSVYDSQSTPATICNATSLTMGSTNTWTTNTSCNMSSGTYTAGNYMTIRVHMSSVNSAKVRIGNITLNYLSNK